ncbi:MAG: hypothetical protein RJA37_1609 [Verrucomicrobiota bacterium]|jgi:hypothetical protein
MSPSPERPALRRFLRGLVLTSLGLLLPCQLTLLWLAKTDRAIQLPDGLNTKVVALLAERGVRFQARTLRLNPDRSLRAEDVTVGFDGAGDGVITAERVDLRLSLVALAGGEIVPTALMVRGGRISVPAALNADGRSRAIVERTDCDVALEGRWLVLRTLRLRSREMTAFVTGEVPASVFATDAAGGAGSLPAALKAAEEWIRKAEGWGLRSVELRLGGGDGGADLRFTGLTAPSFSPREAAAVRFEGLRLNASARVAPGMKLVSWAAEATAEGVTLRQANGALRLNEVSVTASPGSGADEVRLVARCAEALAPGWPAVRGELVSRVGTRTGTARTEFLLHSAGSRIEGSVRTTGQNWEEAHVRRADLSAVEILSLPPAKKTLSEAGVALNEGVILRDVRVTRADGRTQATGAADISGFSALGLSSVSILPGAALPVSARFDYASGRGDKPLRLTDLRLASVTGEAEMSLYAGGPFSLHLQGELAPACLDRVLGRWWTDLWSLFRTRRHPFAQIQVDGEWMKLGARTVGRVKLEDFEFMGAPFRSVEVAVDAGAERTTIGLERLSGGSSPADGSVDGQAVWNWRLPPQEAGPRIDVSGDLAPWVAARCAGKEFSESLKGLKLPADRRLRVVVEPGTNAPIVTAELSAPGATEAWGFPLTDLKARTDGAGAEMRILADFSAAGGEARLNVKGDILSRPKIDLKIAGVRPQALMAAMTGGQDTVPEQARLDLDFKGSLELAKPRHLKGTGTYRLRDPNLKKVRLLGGVSGLLEDLGVDLTTYELSEAKGIFGCIEGKAYFPDMTVTGPEAMLNLAGEAHLETGVLDFIGDFSLIEKGGVPLIGLINPNRALISLTKIRVKGTFSNPTTSAIPRLSDIVKINKDNDLGRIPPSVTE